MIKWKAGRTSATQWFSKWHLWELSSWIMRNQRDGYCISRAEGVTGGMRLPASCQIQLLPIAVCYFSSTHKLDQKWDPSNESPWRCSVFLKYFDIKSESEIIITVGSNPKSCLTEKTRLQVPHSHCLKAHSCSWDEQHQLPAQKITTPTIAPT